MNSDRNSATVNGARIECVLGDIVQQPDVDAVVNAANARLQIGGGVAEPYIRGGAGARRECRSLAPIRPGEAVITGAGKLPNRHIIHTLPHAGGRDRGNEECGGVWLSRSCPRCN